MKFLGFFRSKLFIIAGLLLLIGALLVTIFLIRQNQDIRQNAASSIAECTWQDLACEQEFKDNKGLACINKSAVIDALISRDDSPCKGVDRATVEQVVNDACANECPPPTTAATPTPTPSPTSTPTPSPTGTPDSSPSPTATNTPTPTSTPTPSPTRTPTPSPTPSRTPTPSPTGQASPTPNPSLTATPTTTQGNPTATPTIGILPTATSSPTPVIATATVTPTELPPINTATPTPTIASPGGLAQTAGIIGITLLIILGGIFLLAL